MKKCSILDFRENGEGMRDQDTLPSRTCSYSSHSLHQATTGSTEDGVVFNKVAHSLGGVTGRSPSHSLPHQWKEGLSFPSTCGELIKPEAGRTRERVSGRIDGRLRDIIVQVEVFTLQDENIKLCVRLTARRSKVLTRKQWTFKGKPERPSTSDASAQP